VNLATRDGPLWSALMAIGLGAVIGAWGRWALAYWLNAKWPLMPLGTLTANVVGGYLIGIAIAVFAMHPALSPFWRLVIVTGFLGSLTTFSTFSAESLVMLQSGSWRSAAVHSVAHLLGSLTAAGAGVVTVRLLR
jgi:CrcB protein